MQIEIDGKDAVHSLPNGSAPHGDSAETLRALIPLLTRKTDRSWRQTIDRNIADWWKVLEARAMNSANPINPNGSFGNFRRDYPKTAFSHPIAAAPRIGSHVT